MLKRQLIHPKVPAPQNIATIRDLRLSQPVYLQCGRAIRWEKGYIYRGDTFLLQAVESYLERDHVGHIKQEDYIKFNFWLRGKHTTVLDGFGRYEHERPQMLITAGPREMIKMDLMNAGRSSWVALCVLRDFFATHMGIDPEALPDELRTIVLPKEAPATAYSIPLTRDLAVAARGVLAAPSQVGLNPLYGQSKAIELMCLIIGHMAERSSDPVAKPSHHRQADRLHAARELLTSRYAQPLTLTDIAREVGVSKTALTVGFRSLFGESVFEYLQKERMQRAYDLLQNGGESIEQVARAVGYPHACNFSTAFRSHFGYPPRAVGMH